MPDRVDLPGGKDEDSGPTAAAWRGHTRSQRFIRFLFRFLGPAQTGLPPYATPEEREAFRMDRLPRPARKSEPPPGYRVRVYTDAQGTVHRTLVPAGTEDVSSGTEGVPADDPEGRPEHD